MRPERSPAPSSRVYREPTDERKGFRHGRSVSDQFRVVPHRAILKSGFADAVFWNDRNDVCWLGLRRALLGGDFFYIFGGFSRESSIVGFHEQ